MPGYEILGEEEKQEILDVLSRKVLHRYEFHDQRKGIYKVKEFERAFAEYCGARYAHAVSSGTAALRVALAALGVGPGDEVITQGFTFVATWETILDAGAIPVFAEIDDSLCMDPKDMEKRITKRTKAVLPVHMCGAPARILEIVDIAERHGIPVLEDVAQSCGGRLNGKGLGTFGKAGAFSFDPVKTLTTGEGGMIVTDDEAVYIRASEYHDHGHLHDPKLSRGMEKRNFVGVNYRMMELQGGLGLAQLRKLEPLILASQRKNKARIREALAKTAKVTFRNIPDPQGDTATFIIFSLPTAQKAKEFNRVMAQEGAGAVYWFENFWHYYDEWEHLLGGKSALPSGYPFKDPSGKIRCRFEKGALPRTAELLSKALTIQIYIHMDEQMPRILGAIEKAGASI